MINWRAPAPQDLWRAIDIYLSLAYEGPPPLGVRARLDALRTADPHDLYRSVSFERHPSDDPAHLALRLGNRHYPHMKLVIERAPDGQTPLFRADTHDRHVQPKPGSAETAAFAELAGKNQELSSRIEHAWEQAGLATFKQYLRDDLARRRTAMSIK